MLRLTIPVLAALWLISVANRDPQPQKSAQQPSGATDLATDLSNGITISDLSGSSQDRPTILSRFFANGDIAHYAQAVVDGAPVPTQCDVKTRWPDGSVQHAILSFWAKVPGNGSATVTFADQDSGHNDGALTKEQMLSPDYDLGAQIEISKDGETQSVDARRLLEAGHFRYWLQGPVATVVIIEDPSADSEFDLGFAGKRPFHPIFVATFFPYWPGVKIELIGELIWSSKLMDLNYDLALRIGHPLRQTPVFTKENHTQWARTRWRKVFWSGREPGKVNIDHNLPYMIHSRAVPNFDLTRTLSDRGISEEVEQFRRGDRGEIGGHGQWRTDFGGTGGPPDVGVFPRWTVRYLYAFVPDLLEVMLGNADVSGYVPIHFREADPKRKIRTESDVPAVGRPISIEARTTWVSRDNPRDNYWRSTPPDRMIPLEPFGRSPWYPDLAHQGSFAYVPYLITGDWYYLEEIQFWASFNTAIADVGLCPWCRGPGISGYIVEQVRGEAWGLRTLAHAALMTPDNDPLKGYYHDRVLDNIAGKEGLLNIRDGEFYDSGRKPTWEWARMTRGRGEDNPLYFLAYPEMSNVPANDPGVDPTKAYNVHGSWQHYFNYIVWGHLEELGFPIQTLRRTGSKFLLHQLRDPAFSPYLVGAYYVPVGPAKGVYFKSWAEVFDAYRPDFQTATKFVGGTDNAEHGYVTICYAAASYLTDVDDGILRGVDAWEWIKANFLHPQIFEDNPKFFFAPRSREFGTEANIKTWARPFRKWGKSQVAARLASRK